MKKLIFILLFIPVIVWGQPFATPDAIGFGKTTRGAYAGSSTPTILYVDTLIDASYNSDATHGSLRWAATRTYPRIILFERSGVIQMNSVLQMNSEHSYVTFYGQTAPGKGVVIRSINGADNTFRSYADEVIIQHLRFEGDSSQGGGSPPQGDPLSIIGGRNIYLDHISARYGTDENFGIGSNLDGPVTMANCISSEPFYYGSFDGGYGALFGGNDIDSVTVIRNLFVSAAARFPLINGDSVTRADVINNYIYNPVRARSHFSRINSSASGINMTVNYVGNYMKFGPDSDTTDPQIRFRAGLVQIDANVDNGTFYIYNNWSRNQIGSAWWSDVYSEDGRDSTYFYSATPNYGDAYNIVDYSELFDTLTPNVGAFWWNRDTVDKRVIYEAQTKTGEVIDIDPVTEPFFSEQKYRSDVDSQSVTLSIPGSPHTVSTGGYTLLELWADSLANPTISDTSNCDAVNFIFSPVVTDETNTNQDGSININVTGGTIPYTYSWNDGPTTEDRTGLSAGAYTVTVTDDSTCTADTTINVNRVTSGGGDSITYLTYTTNTGFVEVVDNIYRGSGTTSWAYTGLADQTLDGDGKIWYNVDADSIQVVLGFNTTQEDAGRNNMEYGVFQLDITRVRPYTDGVEGSNINVSFSDGDYVGLERRNDSVFIIHSTDQGANWTELHSFTKIRTGTYYINANIYQEAHQLKYSSILTEGAAPPINIELDSTDVTCTGGSDGTITTTVINGTSPYTFVWDDGPTTQNRTGLSAGWYKVTVTDVNDSTAVDSIQVLDGYSIPLTATTLSSTGSSGRIDLTVLGGTEPYTYLWSNSATTQDISGLAPGYYSVTVTDNNGCTANDTYRINTRGLQKTIHTNNGKFKLNGTKWQ
jgi:hypothetical protein